VHHQIAQNIRILICQQCHTYGYNTPQAFQEKKTLETLKTKLNTNNTILIKANKGNAIPVIYKPDYNEKVLTTCLIMASKWLQQTPQNIFKLKFVCKKHNRMESI
jgi:hypothetical protein